MSEPGIWGFAEEAAPTGAAGTLRLLTGFNRTADSPRYVLAARVVGKPWFIIIWEQLTHGDVPGPEQTKPWCCYLRTVIFYKRPWTETGDGKEFQRWAQIEHTLRCDDVVEFEGEQFDVGPGQVRWHEGNWWICKWARRCAN